MKLQVTAFVIVMTLAIVLTMSCSNKQTNLHPESAVSTPIFTPISTVVEPGLAYGYPCKPPCWRGLVPGQSTGAEAGQVMEQLLADGWANHIDIYPSRYDIFPLPETTKGSIEVTIDNEMVKTIEGDIGFDYPIGTVIKQFGPPEAVRSTQDFATCSSCDMWKPSTEFAWTTLIYLLYPKQGLLFWGWVHPTGTGCLCTEMKISEFCYYEPLSMPEALNNNYLADLCLPALKDITKEDLIEWHGFGGSY